MSATFKTGASLSGCKRWAIVSQTEHYATFCLLEWSKDCVNERGVMFLTDTTVKVKRNKLGRYYKRGIGDFCAEDRERIDVKTRNVFREVNHTTP